MSDSAIPWTAAHQASVSITNSLSLLKLMSIELVMPSNHLILCCTLLLLPLIFPSIRVFSNESALHIRWPKDWNFSFSISPSVTILDRFPLGWTGCDFLAVQGTLNSFLQHHSSKASTHYILLNLSRYMVNSWKWIIYYLKEYLCHIEVVMEVNSDLPK